MIPRGTEFSYMFQLFFGGGGGAFRNTVRCNILRKDDRLNFSRQRNLCAEN